MKKKGPRTEQELVAAVMHKHSMAEVTARVQKEGTDFTVSMNFLPEEYLKEPYARILVREEDGRFSAAILEFPGCFAQGDTTSEAYENLDKAALSWIEAALDLGQEIPPPSANQGYNERGLVSVSEFRIVRPFTGWRKQKETI